jgi:hypothetical protein
LSVVRSILQCLLQVADLDGFYRFLLKDGSIKSWARKVSFPLPGFGHRIGPSMHP